VTQAAQAGYAADYQNKRLPIAVHEAKEMLKAQSSLAEELKEKKPGYVGARVSKRIITDCYARGVCRGAVECSNLTLHAGSNDPTAAETVKTAPVTEISLGYPLKLLEAVRATEPWPQEKARKQVDRRSPLETFRMPASVSLASYISGFSMWASCAGAVSGCHACFIW
jgi:hypothetical protein